MSHKFGTLNKGTVVSKPEESSTASKLNPFEPVKEDTDLHNVMPIEQPRATILQVQKPVAPPTDDTTLEEDVEDDSYLDSATD